MVNSSKIDSISLTAKHIDMQFSSERMFATVEFKKHGERFAARWTVSGLSNEGLPSMLIAMTVTMKGVDRRSLADEARLFSKQHVFPIASSLSGSSGLASAFPQLSVEIRRETFIAHMAHHFSEDHHGGLTAQVKTETLFKMATYLEVVGPLKLISEFQGVRVSTVETRIKRARSTGAIQRASAVRQSNEKEIEKYRA